MVPISSRTVAVSLTAQVAGYVTGMEQARKKTQEVGSEAEKAKALLESQSATMTKVGTGLLAVGALAAVGVGLAVKKFADFDAAISSVQAATHESATNMTLLRDAAIEAGASTVFTATESANAIEELAKAGLSTADILGGALKGSLDLASAGELGVAEAASIMATSMTQFKQPGTDAGHIADLLAAGAGKAQGSVQDLSAALNQGGLVASQAGMSIEETTGTLAAFASAGLIGSDAGTSLKTMLLALEKPSGKAAQLMDQYGISVYNSQGEMLGMSEIAGQLQSKLGGLTDEQRNSTLATIFGTDAVRSASVLYDQGAKGIDSWNAKVNDSGYAAETARIKLDNLNGDVEKLGGAFDTAIIKAGSAADGTLRFLTQTVTGLVDAFGSAPLPVQQTALAIGAVVAATALAGGGFLVAVPKIAEFSAALTTLSASTIPSVASAAVGMQGAITKSGTAMAAAAKFMTGPWGLALAAAAVGVAILSNYLDSLQASSAEVQNALATAADAAQILAVVGEGKEWKWLYGAKDQLKDLPSVLQASADQSENLFARFDQTNFGAFDALKQVGTELAGMVGSDLPAAQHAFQLLTEQTDGSEQSQWRLLNTMPAYKEALTLQAKALGINVTSSDEAANKQALLGLAFGTTEKSTLSSADAYLAAADEADGLTDSVLELMDAINAANGIGQDAVSANAAYQSSLAGISEEVQKQKDDFIQLQKDGYEAANGSLDGFTESLDGFAISLDASTESGSAAQDMLAGVAEDAQAAAAAQYEVDKTTMSAKDATDKYIATLGTSRQAMEDGAAAAGFNKDEVKALADQVFALPTAPEITILVDTAAASAKVAALRDAIRGVGAGTGSFLMADPAKRANGGTIPGLAGGGTAFGPGTSKSDSIHTMLSVGEEVIQEPYASQNRALLKQINSGRYSQSTYVPAPAQSYQGAGSSTSDNRRSSTYQISGEGMSPREVAEAIKYMSNHEVGSAL